MPHTEISTEEVVDIVYREMVAVWAYLITYNECFCSNDPKRNELLNLSAPAFFSLTQSAFIECIVIRLSRLMDPARDSRGNINASFNLLIDKQRENRISFHVKEEWDSIKKKWKEGCYKKISDVRNKILAHNDWDFFREPMMVSTKLTAEEFESLKSLFSELWGLMNRARVDITGASVSEPGFQSIEHLPAEIFRYLKHGLFNIQGERQWEDFEFAKVGEERPSGLINE